MENQTREPLFMWIMYSLMPLEKNEIEPNATFNSTLRRSRGDFIIHRRFLDFELFGRWTINGRNWLFFLKKGLKNKEIN